MNIVIVSFFMVFPAFLAIREIDDGEYAEWCESARNEHFCIFIKNCHFSDAFGMRRGDTFNRKCAADCYDIMYKDVAVNNLFTDFDTTSYQTIFQQGNEFAKSDKCGGFRYYPANTVEGEKICSRPDKGNVCVNLLPNFEEYHVGNIKYGSFENHPWLVRDANDNDVLLVRATSVRSSQKDVLIFQIGKDFGIRVLYCQQGGSCSSGLEHEDVMLASETEDVMYKFWTGPDVIKSKIDAGISSEGGGDDYWIWIENYSGQELKAYWVNYSGTLKFIDSL